MISDGHDIRQSHISHFLILLLKKLKILKFKDFFLRGGFVRNIRPGVGLPRPPPHFFRPPPSPIQPPSHCQQNCQILIFMQNFNFTIFGLLMDGTSLVKEKVILN